MGCGPSGRPDPSTEGPAAVAAAVTAKEVAQELIPFPNTCSLKTKLYSSLPNVLPDKMFRPKVSLSQFRAPFISH